MWEPVTTGCSGASVQHRAGVYRKQTAAAAAEARALGWLRDQGLPAAEVLEVGEGWFTTREIPGRTPAEDWPVHLRSRVVDAVADITNALHAVPGGGCPFDRTLAVTVTEARAAAAGGQIDLADLDEEREGWTATALLRELDRLLPAASHAERAVVTHGDWCLPNLVLDPDRLAVAGIVDAGRVGRADRCTDLALMARSLTGGLNPQYGVVLARRFLDRCGVTSAEEDRFAFYRLLDEFF